MTKHKKNNYDVIIAGAGFAGSLTALILHHRGLKVCLIEKDKHPRFAIGESSTPVADMILRSLSGKYGLPWLYEFSRYGSWQQAHPEIICGIKRGFSFFKHYPGKEFFTDQDHSNELLVAASSNDTLSDTNWLRADVDAFLVNKVKEAGIHYLDGTAIVAGIQNEHWEFQILRAGEDRIMQASFFVDATGSGNLLQRLLGVPSSSDEFQTNSFAVFSHFHHVPRWTALLQKAGLAAVDFPYDPDFSALHQILDEGWIWMLRFNNELTSMGFVLDNKSGFYDQVPTEKIWNGLLQQYPSVQQIFQGAVVANPPGKIIRTQRLQRKISQCYGRGWVALPHTAGFVDPMFSSGIALTLSGLEKIVHAISEYWDDELILQQQLQLYERAFFQELQLMDYLIAGCYQTMAHFPLFNAWSMLYFTFTIMYEQKRLKGLPVTHFLEADNPEVKKMVQATYEDLLQITKRKIISQKNIDRFTDTIRERIKPYNIAGLLNLSSKNMYKHTVAKL
ncbi:MAG TPA: tryptophan 7-halogenase [Chitinophagaceae bacterium]|nr:tryptophan 7-halogenase [Chitinophagaceae bacterium]